MFIQFVDQQLEANPNENASGDFLFLLFQFRKGITLNPCPTSKRHRLSDVSQKYTYMATHKH